jgi:glycolate oxidase
VIDACERSMSMQFPREAQALLLAEVDGSEAETLDATTAVRAILERCGATEVRVAADDEERARLWKARKGAFTALATILPDYYTIDGTIPRRCLPEVLDYVYALSKEYGMVVGNVFHAGDGNIHPCIFYDANKPGELERSEELGGRILERCVEVGRHDHRRARRGHREAAADVPAVPCPELAAFHDVKRAFDPSGILNPGKAVPLLKRCAEWGGTHVRARTCAASRHPALLTWPTISSPICASASARQGRARCDARARRRHQRLLRRNRARRIARRSATPASSPTNPRSSCSR